MARLREIKPDEVTVAIFCALSEESVALELSLDEELECPTSNMKYLYTFGRIREHHIVIAQPNDIGTVNAGNLAVYVSHAFKNVRFALMVGIGGGIPSEKNDIRLGDVAVSRAEAGHPGVIQYDFVKYESDNKSTLKGVLNKPHPILLSADIQVQRDEIRDRSQLPASLDSIIKNSHKYKHPATTDVLYDPTFCHVQKGKDCAACENSSAKKTVERNREREGPKIHRGLIMSGSGVVKDPDERLRLCRGYDKALCFEMEAAGIMDEIPCLVIRGICDYCDTHKQDGWHYYASAVAAAYAKTILLKIQGQEVEKLEQMSETLKKLDDKMDKMHRNIQGLNDKAKDSAEEWFFKTDAFLAWYNGTGPKTLYVEGISGAGKTTLASLAADHLLHLRKSDPALKIAVLFAYYDYKAPDQQRCADMIAGMLKQFLQSSHGIHTAIRQLHDKFGTGKRPTKEYLLQVLLEVTRDYSTVFLIVDALDECSASNRKELKDLIYEIEDFRKDVDIRLLATSRPNELNEILVGGAKATYRAEEKDVLSLLENRIGPNTEFILDPAIWALAKKQVAAAADGILEIPEAGLDKVYETSLTRINNLETGKLEMAQNLIVWAVLSIRPLDVDEISHALAANFKRKKFDTRDVPRVPTILSLTQGLVVYQGKSRGVRPVHKTAYAVLYKYASEIERFKLGGPHQYLASRCFTYLSLDDFEGGFCQTDEEFEERLQSYPLYDYAAHNWGHHARSASTCCQGVVDFLEKNVQVEASSQALIAVKRHSGHSKYSQGFPRQMTGLHLAAFFGVQEAVHALLRKHCLDLKDSYGQTPLSWAARNGHEAVVKLLLNNGANLKSKSDNGQTPLLWAAENGHEAVVKLLLDKDAKLESKSDIGQTPLSWAAENGHEAVVKLLLKKDANLKSKDKVNGQTPLSWAAERGHEAVVKLLVEKGAELESKSNNGQTPLSLAAEYGHKAVVKLLVEKGANLESKSKNDLTPLSWAARNGHEPVVKLLLEKGASLESKNEKGAHIKPKDEAYGQIPLSLAARYGHNSVVKLLFEKRFYLEFNDDKYNNEQLLWAARYGHEAVAKLLLEKGASLEFKDKSYGQTPLSWAARNGRKMVVKLLLEKGANLESKSNNGWTPLSWAAENGHEAVVKLLLEKGVNLESQNKEYNYEQLSWAARNGRETVVKLLIEKGGDLEFTHKNYGHTPLSWAAERGHEAVVKLLVEKGAKLQSTSNNGRTPLSWAAENGHEAVVKLLIEKVADLEFKNKNYGQTPLSWAARNGRETVVKLLLEKGANLEFQDEEYNNEQLSWAARYGCEMVVKLLAEKGANIEFKDKDYGQTPLSWAAERGYEAVVKLLIEKGANLESKSNDSRTPLSWLGRTPLSWAAQYGNEAVVKLLVEKGARLESESNIGQTPLSYAARKTPLSWAAENGHEAVVNQLAMESMVPGHGPSRLPHTLINIRIFSDSQSALLLARRRRASACEKVVEDIIKKLRMNNVPLYWVPSHLEIKGNEKAKKLSKAATGAESEESPKREGCPCYLVKRALTRAEIITGPLLAGQADVRKFTRKIDAALDLPKSAELYQQLTSAEAAIITQLRTGKASVKEYLHNIEASETGACDCKFVKSIQHFLFSCRRWAQQRIKIGQQH
ncbi:hypothetical protein DL764_007492 [Monosporascus ibericus]|uniref:Nucleoside phosphorylase domain-containing protein n=1 Tax=Monosporascus ibericus TaxID=155417 RepID=A0A4Q4T357_9PEZI|nr:hypothetical protein DL764_007492 [Monosporascus ibericus]